MAIELTADQVRYLWLRGQCLVSTQPDGAPAAREVASAVCGLQAQDVFAAALGVRVRSTGATLDDVDRARFEARSVTLTWAMRGTLHLLATEDLDWLLTLVGPAFVAAAGRRRQQLGLDEETYQRGVRAVRDLLIEHGPSTREELVNALVEDAGIEAGYRVERHLLYRAALEGTICMGPNRGTKPTYVLLEDWLGRPLRPPSEEIALAELASRYLAAYAPATPADLAAWSGLPATALRAGWRAVAGGLMEVRADGGPAWLPRNRLAELDEAPAEAGSDVLPRVRLLPAFDTYLLGHRSRDRILDSSQAKRINAGGGMIKPVLLVDGCVAGIWLANRKGRRVNVTLEPFGPLSTEVQMRIAAETADIDRFVRATPAMPPL